MLDLNRSPTCSPCEVVIDVSHGERGADSLENCGEPKHLVRWPWPRVLVAQVQSTSLDVSNDIDTLQLIFVSPTTTGLAALETSQLSIKSLWLIFSSEDGSTNLRGTCIQEISTWPTASTVEPPLTVLRTAENKLLGIDENEIFNFEKLSSTWNGSGQVKRPKDEHE